MIETMDIVYGASNERVVSPRYCWDSSRRGETPFVIVQRTLSGEGLVEWRGRKDPVPADHAFIVIVPERSVYRYPEEAVEPWTFSWLNFYGPSACRLFAGLRETFGCVVPLPADGGLAARFEEFVALAAGRSRTGAGPERSVYARSAEAYRFVMDWCDVLGRPQRSPVECIEALKRHIETRFYEPGNIKTLAARFGVSREHLTREYRRLVGIAPAAHLRTCRVQAARELLARTKLPHAEVARRTGFSDARHLGRALRSGSVG